MYFMKSTLVMISSLHVVSAGFVGSKYSNGVGGNNGVGAGVNNGKGGVSVGEVKCVLQRQEPLMINEDDDDSEVATTVCEMDAVYEEGGIRGIAYTVDQSSFPYGFFKDVEYSETELTISKASVKKNNGKRGGILAAEPGATFKKEKKDKKNPQGKLRGSGNPIFDRRRLAQKTGNSTLIVLYTIPLDAINDKRTSTELANDIFGINTTDVQDQVNVRSQMAKCSGGQLNYIPACGTAEQTCFNASLITNGIMNVPIDKNITGVKSGDVVNWVKAEAQVMLNQTGIDLFDDFTQIMVVIPDEASWGGAAAWAYLPGQLSAFRDNYAYRMGTQMHEFGHNLGLHHSGYEGKQYKDHSCMMGSSSYGDDGPAICWNAAKSWELGWYASDSVTVDPAAGVGSFELVGAADYGDGIYSSGVNSVVLQIVDSTEVFDFYVIYNRAKGPNNGVTFAKDEVTISTGLAKKVSWHQAGLGAPNATENHFPLFRKPNYNGGTQDLVVKVCGMAAGTEGITPDTASVLVYLDDGPGWNNGEMCPGEVSCLSDLDCDDGNWCTSNTCDLASKTCNAPVDISATVCPSCGGQTFCNPGGYCDLLCDDRKECTSDSCVSEQCQHDLIPGCAVHGGLLETWLNIGGNKVSDLTGSYSYNNRSPDEVTILQDGLKTDVNRAKDFGDRLRTYIFPKESGTYNFYVASDDHSELYLSADADPANKVKIAWVTGYTGPEVWDKFTSQKSSDINLVEGQAYYLEALHKEGGGGDHLAVAWESTDAPMNLTVIGSNEFFVEPPVPCTLDSHCAALVTNPCDGGYCNMETAFCEYLPISGCQNGGQLETWTGISGTSVQDLTTHASFPDAPDQVTVLGDVLEAPSAGDNFGRRLRTYIMPPATGEYIFHIASDDQSELWLSTDTDPSKKVKIASVTGYTKSREWFKYSSQTSSRIPMEKGQLYYLEALHKDGGSSDNLAIAWECLQHDNFSLQVIDASYTTVSPVQATPQPSKAPSKDPTKSPTEAPIPSPTHVPTVAPTMSPSNQPTNAPTNQPSASPSKAPSAAPTTASPTNSPSTQPTNQPSANPSKAPSASPSTANPTNSPSARPTKAPTSTPTISPTSSPTISPSRSPTTQPTNTPTGSPNSMVLQDVGDNGSPAEAFPLKVCQGDCDYDSNCEGDLLCYQRSGTLAVPGCTGSGSSGKDYCAERPTENTLFLRRNNGNLGACDGNCQSDTDCVGTLVCEAPDGNGEVPGCIGLAHPTVKYCQYPPLVEVGADGSPAESYPLEVCQGACDNDTDCQDSLECFLRIGTEAVPGCLGDGVSGVGYCTERPHNYLWIKPASAGPLGVCDGNCESDTDCDGNLVCQERTGDEEVPGCDGPGRTAANYCRYPLLADMGNNGGDAFPLGLCAGDCDNDDECQDGLLCFHRTGSEDVVGCSGTGTGGWDYCAERPTNTTLFLRGNNGAPAANFPLGLCQGDCDNDSECEGSLVCFNRGGTQEVPGCEGLGASGKDYCHVAV